MSDLKKTRDSIYLIDDGEQKFITKHLMNPDFARIFNVKTSRFTTTGESNEVYNAFPVVTFYGTRIVGLYSIADSHANSSQQIMFQGGRNAEGQSFNSVVFFDNATGQYNTSLVDSILAEGDSIVLKVWTLKKESGVVNVYVNSSITHNGLSYALWGEPVLQGGVLYRTGYSFVADNYNAAVFTSADGGVTWMYLSTIASGNTVNGHIFNEAALYYVGSNKWFSVIRDDSTVNGSGRLYYSESLDSAATWSAPVVMPEDIVGRQPNLTRVLGSNYVALTTGKRTGNSGTVGFDGYYGDRTGVALYLSKDNGETWASMTMLDGMYSSDGGQPWAVSYLSGRLLVLFYARKSIEELPDIYSVALDVNTLAL